ncbi:hypothetical protein WN73_26380 [Bradyrhizobium sp. CCBAU 45394]|nr:hypothetical protein [Bradyrhizobium sp. CCBAU 45394]
MVQAEYLQDWLTERLEASCHKQAAWRTDPVRSGAGGCIGDIGTHALVHALRSAEAAPDPGRRRRLGRGGASHPCPLYLEGFATIYAETARAIHAAEADQKPDPEVIFPSVEDGLAGVKFIDAADMQRRLGSDDVTADAPRSPLFAFTPQKRLRRYLRN